MPAMVMVNPYRYLLQLDVMKRLTRGHGHTWLFVGSKALTVPGNLTNLD